MRQCGSKYRYYWFGILVFLCLHPVANGQKLSQFCRQGGLTDNDAVLIEVARVGRGMTWPLIPQLFLRVYNDGRIEYEVRDGNKLVTKKAKLDSTAIERFRKIVDAKDLAEPRLEYPMLKSVSDALMKICVTYKVDDQHYRQILLVNYMPDHPKAKGYYPASLVELLRMIEDLRPSNEYERRHGFDKLSFG